MPKHLTAPPSPYWAIDEMIGASLLDHARGLFAASRERVEVEKDWDDWSEPGYELASNGDAIIRIQGAMTKHLTCLGWMFGGCPTKATRAAVRAADADLAVSRIVLLIDSPGGEVAGTADLGDAIRECQKPTVAYIEDTCCSAAYWVASQCDEIVANEMAMVGSIGVFTVIYDWSKAFADEGIRPIVVRTSPIKGTGVMGDKVTPAQTAEIQRLIDSTMEAFTAAILAVRPGIDQEVFDARVLRAPDALTAGLIDRIGRYEDEPVETQPISGTLPVAPAASAATDPETIETMGLKLSDFGKLFFKGEQEEDTPVAQTTPETPATAATLPTAVDPAVQAKIDALTKQTAEVTAKLEDLAKASVMTRANAEAERLIAEGFVIPAAKEKVKECLTAAAEADASGSWQSWQPGANYTAAIAALEANRHGLTTSVSGKLRIEAADPAETQPDAKAEAAALIDKYITRKGGL